jgi:hypothetical protein
LKDIFVGWGLKARKSSTVTLRRFAAFLSPDSGLGFRTQNKTKTWDFAKRADGLAGTNNAVTSARCSTHFWSHYHQKDVRARLKLAESGRIFTPKQEVEVYDYRSQLGAQTKLKAVDLLNDASVLKHFFLFGDISKEEARVLTETAAFAKFSYNF